MYNYVQNVSSICKYCFVNRKHHHFLMFYFVSLSMLLHIMFLLNLKLLKCFLFGRKEKLWHYYTYIYLVTNLHMAHIQYIKHNTFMYKSECTNAMRKSYKQKQWYGWNVYVRIEVYSQITRQLGLMIHRLERLALLHH